MPHANVRDYKGPCDPDDSAAIAAAHAANRVVYYPAGDYTPGAPKNIYGINYTNALGPRYMSGLEGSATQHAEPIMWLQKVTSTNRQENKSEWDQGGLYSMLIKESGNSFGASITGMVRHQTDDGGQVIGVHARGVGYKAGSEVWGGWSYAASGDPATVPKSVISHEFNLNNKNPDQGWMAGSGHGATRGLVVVTQDRSNPVTHGIYVGNGSGAPAGQMHTGILLKGGGIVPADADISAASVANNEAIRIEGASVSADSYTAIRFRTGRFRTGVSFAEATYDNNAAILMADDQRIVIGAGPGSSTHLGFNKANATANFNNMNLAINGTKVIGPQRAGWGVIGGTANRNGYDTATVSTAQLAERVKALIDDLKTHGLIGA